MRPSLALLHLQETLWAAGSETEGSHTTTLARGSAPWARVGWEGAEENMGA